MRRGGPKRRELRDFAHGRSPARVNPVGLSPVVSDVGRDPYRVVPRQAAGFFASSKSSRERIPGAEEPVEALAWPMACGKEMLERFSTVPPDVTMMCGADEQEPGRNATPWRAGRMPLDAGGGLDVTTGCPRVFGMAGRVCSRPSGAQDS